MKQNHQEDLKHIREMMERSSRVISLSGWSGVWAGTTALAGAVVAYFLMKREGIDYFHGYRHSYSLELMNQLMMVAAAVLVISLVGALFFTIRKSRKNNLKLYNKLTAKLLLNLAIPLIVGGVFCLILLNQIQIQLIAASTLIFYGLALINASHYTFSDVRYLGYCEIILGIIALLTPGIGLVYWAIGFGVLHIVYGIIMQRKYQ